LLRKTVTSFAVAAVLAVPVGNVAAATHAPKIVLKKKVEILSVTGPSVPCKKWGPLQVRIKIRKTTTTIGTKNKVAIRILAIDFPIVSDATFKTKYINQQALPLLVEEVLEIQSANVETISGATDTTVSFKQSLQAAILQAKKP
jgi:uncharacterized protein with FMN-binding domain